MVRPDAAALTAWSGRAGESLSPFHKSAALPLLKDAALLSDALSPTRAARLLDDEHHFLALVWLGEVCVAAAVFRPESAQLVLVVCSEAARRTGIGRALVGLAQQACAQNGGEHSLWMVTPREMTPGARKFFRAVGFVGSRSPPVPPAAAPHPWKVASELTAHVCQLPPPGAPSELLSLASDRVRARSGSSGKSDAREKKSHKAKPAGPVEGPSVGALIALWMPPDRRFYAARVVERSMVLGSKERGGATSYSLYALAPPLTPDCAPSHMPVLRFALRQAHHLPATCAGRHAHPTAEGGAQCRRLEARAQGSDRCRLRPGGCGCGWWRGGAEAPLVLPGSTA